MNTSEIMSAMIFGDGGASKVEELSTDGGSTDAGKVLVVGDNGKIAASDLTVGEGEVAIDKTLSVNGAAADAKKTGDALASLNGSLGTLREDLSTISESKWVKNSDYIKNNITRAAFINSASGIKTANVKYAITSLFSTYRNMGVKINSDIYVIRVASYNAAGNIDDGTGYLGSTDFTDGFVAIPQEAVKACITIRRVDNSVLTVDEIETIKTALDYYGVTDWSLSMSGVPADAKIVGNIADGNKTYTITPNFTTGAYVYSNNAVMANSNFAYSDYVDVKPYNSVHVKYNFTGTGPHMVFLSEDRETVVAAYARGDLSSTSVDIDVPENAAWFRSSQRSTNISDFLMTGTLKYIDAVKELFSAEVPTEERPLDNIIHDGGFCKILNTIGVVGDSLSSGSIAKPNSASSEESTEEVVDLVWYSWIQQMARYSGLTAYNFSMGGLSAHGLRFETDNPNVQEIIANLESDNKKCKAYFVALGHNDRNYANSSGTYSIGTIDDCNLNDPTQNADTYYGNIAWVISKIKAVQPRAKIFLITMKIASTFSAYNVAIRDMIGLFNTYYNNTDVYLIDMEGKPFDTSWEYYKGHGSPQGYLNYSYQISSYVDYIIRTHQNDFKTIPYIGTQFLT